MLAREDVRAMLVADAQRVAEALGDREHGRLAAALEQRVGRDRGAHLDRIDRAAGSGSSGAEPEQRADALQRGVVVLPRVVGEQLVHLRASPSGARPTTSVNVPPRSIQNCQPARRSTIALPSSLPRSAAPIRGSRPPCRRAHSADTGAAAHECDRPAIERRPAVARAQGPCCAAPRRSRPPERRRSAGGRERARWASGARSSAARPGSPIGGPIGAVIGAVAGHAFDHYRGGEPRAPGAAGRPRPGRLARRQSRPERRPGRAAAGLRRPDRDPPDRVRDRGDRARRQARQGRRRVTRDEIRAFKRVFRIDDDEVGDVARIYNQAKASARRLRALCAPDRGAVRPRSATCSRSC